MCLDGVFADEKLFSNFSIAQPFGNQLQDLQLAGRYPQLLQSLLIQNKRCAGRNLAQNDCFLAPGEPQSEPDPQRSEHRGDQTDVDLDGTFDDEEAVLHQFEESDQDAAQEAIYKDVPLHGRKDSGGHPKNLGPSKVGPIAEKSQDPGREDVPHLR
jgi:hypothetical protein